MAYILGFTFADGNVYKTTLSWDLKEDRELLEKINQAMDSNYPIHRRKASFRLRISNPVIVSDLQNLGVYQNKSKKMQFPKVHPEFFSHFARGFFDGDGWIYIRESRNEISVGFANGSQKFLKEFIYRLFGYLGLMTDNFRIKRKVTKRGIRTAVYQVDYFSSIYRWLIKTETRPAFTEIRRKGVVDV